MLGIDVLWVIILFSLFCSGLFSYILLKLEKQSSFELRSFIKRENVEDEVSKLSNIESQLLSTFKLSRIVANIFFVAFIVWHLGHSEHINSLVFLLLELIIAITVLWFTDITLPTIILRKVQKRVSIPLIYLIKLLFWLLYPFTWIFVFLEATIRPPETSDVDKKQAEEFEDEIRSLIDEGEKRGVFDEHEGDLLQALVEFSDTVVREVMTPRLDFIAIEQTAPVSELVEKILEHGFSRIPVFKDRIDNLIGVVFAKDLLAHWHKSDEEINIKELLREAYFVPETKKIMEMLKEFQMNKNHMAIVVDEYGGISGLVTIEDLLEEIVGEIRDEYDNEVDLLQVNADNSVTVDARLNVEDLEEQFGIELPREDFDTVGGLIFHILGRVPRQGEEIVYDDLVMKVLSAEERRVHSIHIHLKKKADTENIKEEQISEE